MKKTLMLILIFSSAFHFAYSDTMDSAANMLTKKMSSQNQITPPPVYYIESHLHSKEYNEKQIKLRNQWMQKQIQQIVYISSENADGFLPIVIPSFWQPMQFI